MAFHNTNFEVKSLSGTQKQGDLGNGLTASTIHRVYCLTAGTISITPMQGDSFTWVATANQFIDVMVAGTSISSGGFIGFKAQHNFGNAFYNNLNS